MSRKVLDLSAPPPPPANAWGKKPTQSTPSTKPTPPKPTPPKSAPSSQTQSPQSSQPSGHVSAASGPPPPQPKGWTTLSKDSNKPSDTKNRINVNRGETFPIGSPALRQWVTNQSKRFTPDFAVLIDAFVTDPDMGEIREFANGVLGASPKLNDFLIELERKRGGLSSSSSSSPSSSVSNEAAWKSSASGTEGKNSGEQGPPPPPGTLQRQVSTDLLNDRNDLIKGPTLGGFLGASHELKERNQNQGGNAFGGGKSLSSKKESRIEDLIRYLTKTNHSMLHGFAAPPPSSLLLMALIYQSFLNLIKLLCCLCNGSYSVLLRGSLLLFPLSPLPISVLPFTLFGTYAGLIVMLI